MFVLFFSKFQAIEELSARRACVGLRAFNLRHLQYTVQNFIDKLKNIHKVNQISSLLGPGLRPGAESRLFFFSFFFLGVDFRSYAD